MLVARDDPLDTYLVHHPDALFGKPVEATVLDPANPYVLAPHLCCAAAELPLTDGDLPSSAGPAPRPVLDELVAAGCCAPARRAGSGRRREARPDVDLRGIRLRPGAVVESDTGRLLGTVDPGAAPVTVHVGAVYLHQGETYVVEDLDLDAGSRWCAPRTPDGRPTPADVPTSR